MCPHGVRIHKTMTHIGPHSRPGKLAIIDGRRAEARRMKEITAQLSEHVGGAPSVTQQMLIGRIAALMLRVELMDKEVLSGTPQTERDQRAYLGWNNSISRLLRQLGLQGRQPKAMTLQEHVRARGA